MEDTERKSYNFKMDELKMSIKIEDRKAPHPSEVFKQLLESAGMGSVQGNRIAITLGISRNSYYSFLNCRTGISPEMAVRLARFFHLFQGKKFEDARSARYWWRLNCEWIFCNSLQDTSVFVGDTVLMDAPVNGQIEYRCQPGDEILIDGDIICRYKEYRNK